MSFLQNYHGIDPLILSMKLLRSIGEWFLVYMWVSMAGMVVGTKILGRVLENFFEKASVDVFLENLITVEFYTWVVFTIFAVWFILFKLRGILEDITFKIKMRNIYKEN